MDKPGNDQHNPFLRRSEDGLTFEQRAKLIREFDAKMTNRKLPPRDPATQAYLDKTR